MTKYDSHVTCAVRKMDKTSLPVDLYERRTSDAKHSILIGGFFYSFILFFLFNFNIKISLCWALWRILRAKIAMETFV